MFSQKVHFISILILIISVKYFIFNNTNSSQSQQKYEIFSKVKNEIEEFNKEQNQDLSVETLFFSDENKNENEVGREYFGQNQQNSEIFQNSPHLRNLQNIIKKNNNLQKIIESNNKGYSGKWESAENSGISNQFNFLDGNEGRMEMVFFYTLVSDKNLENNDYHYQYWCLFLMFDPQWYDEKIIYFYQELSQSPLKGETLLDGENYYIVHAYNHLYLKRDYNVQSQDKMQSLYQLEFINRNGDGEIQESSDLQINFHIQNANESQKNKGAFNIKGQLIVDTQNYTLQAFLYSVFASAILGIQLYSVEKLLQYFAQNELEYNKLSIITLSMCTIYDIYICLGNLYLALLRAENIYFFLIPCIISFLLASVYEIKLVVMAWKVRYSQQLQNNQQIRRAVSCFYAKFYTSIFIFLLLMYYLYIFNWFSIFLSFLLVPQIVHNVIRGIRTKFYPWYIYGLMLTRIFIPLYFRGCPNNIRDYKPSTSFCIAFTIITLLQILILYLQHKLGPRFFVPRRCFGQYYEYVHKIEVDLNQNDDSFDDCAICLTHLHLDPNAEPEETFYTDQKQQNQNNNTNQQNQSQIEQQNSSNLSQKKSQEANKFNIQNQNQNSLISNISNSSNISHRQGLNQNQINQSQNQSENPSHSIQIKEEQTKALDSFLQKLKNKVKLTSDSDKQNLQEPLLQKQNNLIKSNNYSSDEENPNQTTEMHEIKDIINANTKSTGNDAINQSYKNDNNSSTKNLIKSEEISNNRQINFGQNFNENDNNNNQLSKSDNQQKHNGNKSRQKQKKNIKKIKVMITPCGHKFHISCLNGWIELKLECPSCRGVLPPP